MSKTTEENILDLLKTSKIPGMIKSLLEAALPSYEEAKKKNILKILVDEERSLFLLAQKKLRIVSKYQDVMANVQKIPDSRLKPTTFDE